MMLFLHKSKQGFELTILPDVADEWVLAGLQVLHDVLVQGVHVLHEPLVRGIVDNSGVVHDTEVSVALKDVTIS